MASARDSRGTFDAIASEQVHACPVTRAPTTGPRPRDVPALDGKRPTPDREGTRSRVRRPRHDRGPARSPARRVAHPAMREASPADLRADGAVTR